MSSVQEALEKLCKWRSVFAGWQLGTRTKEDAEAQAVRDHREVTLLLRAEVNALSALLILKGVVSAEEFNAQLKLEAEHLDRAYEQKFPGIHTEPYGVVMDVQRVSGWMKNWRP